MDRDKKDRKQTRAYTTTMRLYQEKRTALGRESSDMGFSRGHIVKVCDADYITDVENIARSAVEDSPVLDKFFLGDELAGRETPETWLAQNSRQDQFDIVKRRVQLAVGEAFLKNGIHPYALYSKPVDVR